MWTEEYWNSPEQEFWEGQGPRRWFLVGVDAFTGERGEIPETRCASLEGAQILKAQLAEHKRPRWCGITIEYA